MDDNSEVNPNPSALALHGNSTDPGHHLQQQVSGMNPVVKPTTAHKKSVVYGNKVKTTEKHGRASNIKESAKSVIGSVDIVETRAKKRGLTLLKKDGVVIVIGGPGSGKTTLAWSMIKQIEEEENREYYLLTHHSEFSDIDLSPGRKCIFVIDDIFGKTNLISDFMSSWQPKFSKMWSLVQDGSVKCIITLRNEIFAKSKTSLKEYDLFKENHRLDLQSDDYCLNEDEKKEILNTYLKQENVTMGEKDKDIVIQELCTELGFPQMCVFYVKSSDAQKSGVEFFRKPVEYLTQQLQNMRSDKSLQINYLVLLLIMFKKGSLSIDLLNPFENDSDSEIMKLVKQLERVCPSLKNTGLEDINKAANLMCGTYLKLNDSKYTFIHQSVFDALFLMFQSEFPKKAKELQC